MQHNTPLEQFFSWWKLPPRFKVNSKCLNLIIVNWDADRVCSLGIHSRVDYIHMTYPVSRHGLDHGAPWSAQQKFPNSESLKSAHTTYSTSQEQCLRYFATGFWPCSHVIFRAIESENGLLLANPFFRFKRPSNGQLGILASIMV